MLDVQKAGQIERATVGARGNVLAQGETDAQKSSAAIPGVSSIGFNDADDLHQQYDVARTAPYEVDLAQTPF